MPSFRVAQKKRKFDPKKKVRRQIISLIQPQKFQDAQTLPIVIGVL
jgi:hypothetical protein